MRCEWWRLVTGTMKEAKRRGYWITKYVDRRIGNKEQWKERIKTDGRPLVRVLNEGSRRTHVSPINIRVQLLHIRRSNHASLQCATTLLQQLNQRIKFGLVCGRLLANRRVIWMPFNELTVCLILDEAERKEDVGDKFAPGTRRSLGYIS